MNPKLANAQPSIETANNGQNWRDKRIWDCALTFNRDGNPGAKLFVFNKKVITVTCRMLDQIKPGTEKTCEKKGICNALKNNEITENFNEIWNFAIGIKGLQSKVKDAYQQHETPEIIAGIEASARQRLKEMQASGQLMTETIER